MKKRRRFSKTGRFLGGTMSLAMTLAAGTGAVSESRDPVFEYRGKNGYTEQRLINGKYENYCYSADDDWSLDEEYRFAQDYSLKESYILPGPVGEDDEGDYVYRPEGTTLIRMAVCIRMLILTGSISLMKTVPGMARPSRVFRMRRPSFLYRRLRKAPRFSSFTLSGVGDYPEFSWK